MEQNGGDAEMDAGADAGAAARAAAGEGAARVTVSLQADGDTVSSVRYQSPRTD